MPTIRFLPTRLFLLMALCCIRPDAPAANPARAAGVPVAPTAFPVDVAGADDVIWVHQVYHFGEQRGSEAFHTLWSPAGGSARTLDVPTHYVVEAAARTASGLVFLASETVFPARPDEPHVVMFLPDGDRERAPAQVTLPVPRTGARLVALADGSVLVVGGARAPGQAPVNTVERVSGADGRLRVDRLPDVPGVPRTGYALIALHDGRAMIIGGTAEKTIGCLGCLADTFLLDPATGGWTAGPALGEPRANPAAALLADGSVLVAGGWTPGHGWSEGASRTTERWTPGSGVFVPGAALPVGVAMHRAARVAGLPGHLLLWGGMTRADEDNRAVVDFDAAAGTWRVVGDMPCERDTRQAGAVLRAGQAYLWCLQDFQAWRFAALRLGSAGPAGAAPDLVLRRSEMAFLPADGDRPALALGGLAGGVVSAGADAVWPDGRAAALAAPSHARYGAQAFVLADGSILLVGGYSRAANANEVDARPMPAERLAAGGPLERAAWSDAGALPAGDVAVGQAADKSLLVLDADGTLRRIALRSGAAGGPAFEQADLPAPNRRRAADGAGRAVVRGLADGRTVVAGGAVQVDNIAVLRDDAMRADAPDRYVGVGAYLPARRHEVFDPATRTWRNSAPSRGAGGPVVVLDDGRVLRVTQRTARAGVAAQPGYLEISTPAGDAWHAFEQDAVPRIRLDGEARPFLLQGELFLAGTGAADAAGNRPRLVEWFDGTARRWRTVWEAARGGNWRDDVGRIVVRTLANGKRVVLPVESL